MPDQPTTHREFHDAMRAGDERLRDHIDRSIAEVGLAVEAADRQVSTALEAAERLETQRISATHAMIQALGDRVSVIAEHLAESDGRLRTHIAAQAAQIEDALTAATAVTKLALAAAEKLEVERVARVEAAAREQAEGIKQRMDEGDERLRQHIHQQIEQVGAAHTSLQRETYLAHQTASELEKTRIDDLHARIEGAVTSGHTQVEQRISGVQREVDLVQRAQAQAVEKAEKANEKRFEAVNEFRAQLADQATSFIPREVFETTVAALTERIRGLELTGSRSAGASGQEHRTQDRMQPWMIWAVGILVTIAIFAANLLTSG